MLDSTCFFKTIKLSTSHACVFKSVFKGHHKIGVAKPAVYTDRIKFPYINVDIVTEYD